MKVKKLALICMTALLFVIGVPKVAFAATITGSCGDNATYSYDDVKKELVISGSGKITDDSWKKAGYKTKVTSIVINEGITESDWWTFKGFSALTSVKLPSSMTIIGDYAFQYCDNLKSVVIPKTVKQADFIFKDSGLETITFEDGMTTIPGFICYGCENLTKVNFPKGVKIIGSTAFKSCNKLIDVKIPSTVETIEDYAFQYCEGLKSIVIPKSVKQADFIFKDSGLETITFEDGMTTIPGFICYGCENLTKVNFPQTVKKIKGSAFEECEGLTEVTLPWYLEEIGFYTFKDCSNLKKVTMYQKLKKIDTYAFKNLKGLTIYGKKGTTAQKFAKKNNYTFKTCKIPALKGITYKKGDLKYKVVKDYANNKGTVMVTGLSKKKSSITIPDKVKLESYNYKVVKIDKKAFYKQSKLKKITIKANSISSMGSKAFYKINSKATVYVPKKKYSSYKRMLKKAGLSSKVKIKKK